MGLLQRDVAQQLGVNVDTVTNWELSRTTPALRFIPGIVRFLDYVPFPTSDSLPQLLKTYRNAFGLSKKFATIVGVDPTTMARWESGRSRPSDDHVARLKALLPA